MKRRLFLISSFLLTLYLLPGAPGVAFAHGGGQEPAAAAGPLSWGFLGFGALVIAIVSFILYAPRRSTGNAITSADFERLTGFRGYLAKMRLFSPTLLLLTAAGGGIFGAIHGVAEPAFMAENSRDFRTPFFLMAGFLLVGALLFWRFFAGWEAEGAVAQVPSRLEAAPVGD